MFVNQVQLTAYAVLKPKRPYEIRQFPSGAQVLNLRVNWTAYSKRGGVETKTPQYVEVTLWGDLATEAMRRVNDAVAAESSVLLQITGRLEYWDRPESEEKPYVQGMRIVADHVLYVAPRLEPTPAEAQAAAQAAMATAE